MYQCNVPRTQVKIASTSSHKVTPSLKYEMNLLQIDIFKHEIYICLLPLLLLELLLFILNMLPKGNSKRGRPKRKLSE